MNSRDQTHSLTHAKCTFYLGANCSDDHPEEMGKTEHVEL